MLSSIPTGLQERMFKLGGRTSDGRTTFLALNQDGLSRHHQPYYRADRPPAEGRSAQHH